MKRPLLVVASLCLGAASGLADDSSQRHLFYLHGAWIEQHGLRQPHPQHGPYEYERIVRTLADAGFVVISEARLHDVAPPVYAEQIAGQVRELLRRGVPANQITVIGHSKGGHMALLVASLVQEPTMHVVVMAGCGKPGTMFRRSYERFLATHASRLQGHILSIYDAADREAGSCHEAFAAAADGVESREVVLSTGRGHGLFYTPEPVWLTLVTQWAGG